MPLRDHVVAPQQHAVQRAGGCYEGVAIGRLNQEIDELVSRRILDAGQVSAAAHVGRGRGPVIALLVARAQ